MQNNKFVSRQDMQSMLDNRPKGVDGKAFIDKWVANGYTVEGINDKTVEKAPEKSLGDKLSERFKNITDAGSEIASSIPNKDTTFQESTDAGLKNAKNTAKVLGNSVGILADLINTGIGEVSDAVGVTKLIERGVNALPENVQIQLGEAILKGEDIVNQVFPDETIRGEMAKAVGNVLSVAGSVSGASVGAKLLKKAGTSAAKTAVATTEKVVETAGQVLDKTKGVTKPLIEKTKGIARNVGANLEEAKKTEDIISKLPSVAQQKAVRVGVDIADINTLSRIKKENLTAVKSIVGAADDFARGVSASDPQEIVGKPLTQKILQLDKLREEVGAKLGKVSENLGILDNGAVETSVLGRLQKVTGLKGLKLDGKGGLDFGETTLKSSLTSSDRSAIETAFKEAVDSGSGKQAHLFRQELFEVLDGKKRSLSNITDTQDKALQAIRQGLSDILEKNNPEYKTLSNEYRKIVQPLSDLRKLNKNLTADNESAQDILDISGGLLARRLTSNAPSRAEVMRVLKELDNATTVKGETAQTLQDLIEAYSVVGKYYDIAPKTSFKGLTQQAGGISEEVMNAMTSLAGVTPAVRQKMLREIIDELLTKN